MVNFIFIVLIIANGLFVFWAIDGLLGSTNGADLRGVAIAFLSLPLLLIDFIALVFYIIKHRQKRININIISYSCLTIVCFLLTFNVLPFIALILDQKLFEKFGTAIISPFNVTPFILVELPFRAGIAIVITALTIFFLHFKPRK